jgi:hypothetical protein
VTAIFATEPSAAVFHRRPLRTHETEAQSQALSVPAEPAWTDQPLVIRVSERHRAAMMAVLDRMRSFLDLPEGWDSYGARPVNESTFRTAAQILCVTAIKDVVPPSVVPTSGGGVQLEWHTVNADLEFTIEPNSAVEAFLDMHNGSTWTGELATAKWYLERFLDYVADR